MINALVPELAVRDAKVSKAFYCDILGFDCLYERPEEGFAFLRLDDAQLMVDQIDLGRSFGDGHLPTSYPFGKGLNLQIKVSSIEVLTKALLRAGRELYLEPEEKWYRRENDEIGQRQFVVADPDGYLLRFFQPI